MESVGSAGIDLDKNYLSLTQSARFKLEQGLLLSKDHGISAFLKEEE